MPKQTIRDLDLAGKKALIRVDFNVPQTDRGDVSDDRRIKSALPTLKHVLDRGAERLGFDAFFRSDHYQRIGEGSPGPGSTDAWMTLARAPFAIASSARVLAPRARAGLPVLDPRDRAGRRVLETRHARDRALRAVPVRVRAGRRRRSARVARVGAAQVEQS